MIDDRLINAIDRLEQAILTLEDALPAALAADAPSPAPPAAAESAEAAELRERLERLEERHAALRDRTSSAVERLSQLLDAAQGE